MPSPLALAAPAGMVAAYGAYGTYCVAGDRLQACDAAGDWGDATVLKKHQRKTTTG